MASMEFVVESNGEDLTTSGALERNLYISDILCELLERHFRTR